MSAIAGLLNLDGRPVDVKLLQLVTEALATRGPDGKGYWLDGPIGLGHRLLHTTPESLHESQPFSGEDGKLVIVCDGRIDNRAELEATFKARGTKLRTDTDVELILSAYESWGTFCPQHLLGDFAFAIWDQRRRSLFCARDPIGIKPFYYAWDGWRFLFASEIKALLAAGIPKKVNEAMVAAFLLSDFRDPEATFFDGIMQLRPAHSLCVEAGEMRLARYWDPSPTTVEFSSDEAYFERFRELLREAVRCRLRSHPPGGVMLSGGADSTSVAAMAESLRQGHSEYPAFTAFTLLFEGFLRTEWETIQRLVKRFGTDVCTIRPEAHAGFLSYLELLPPCYAFESPFIVGIFAYSLFYGPIRARGCRAILTGFGADELEQPSEVGVLKDLLRAWRLKRLVREIQRMARSYGTATRAIADQLRDQVPPWTRWLVRTMRGRQVPSWIEPGFAKRLGLPRRMPLRIAPRFPRMCQEESFRMLTMPAMVLHFNELDLIASSSQIEWRHPYLDRRLIEFFLSVPFPVKLNAGYEKPFTRKMLTKILPGPSRDPRDGEEFVPLQEGPMSRTFEAQHIEQVLGPFHGPLFRYVRAHELERLMREFVSDERIRTQLWTIAHLKRWLQAFFPEEHQTREAPGGLEPVSLATQGGKLHIGGVT